MAIPKNDFGAFGRDANHNAVQTGSAILTLDSLRSSPFAIPSTAIFDLVIPTNAAEVVLRCSEDLRVSEDATMTTYYVLPGGITQAFGVTRMSQLFIKLNVAATGTLNFYYVTV